MTMAHSPLLQRPLPLLISLTVLGLTGAQEAGAATSGWIRNPQSAVRLVTPYAVAPRGEIRLGVEFALSPGWHAYWRNPGSAGFPPGFESGVPELRILEIRWPAPRRFELPGDLVAFGYEHEVVYPLRARLESAADTVRMVVNADYLVCEIECVPYRYDLVLDQPLAATPTPDAEGEAALGPWEARVPAPISELAGFVAEGSIAWQDDTHGTLSLVFPGAAGEPELFTEIHDLFEIGRGARQAGSEVRFVAPVKRKNTSRALPLATDVGWTLVGLGSAPAHLEGRTSVAVREQSGVDWRWIAAAAALVAILLALFVTRRPPPANL